MYKPIQPSQARTSQITTLMAKRGENLRDLPQFLNPEYALEITNYLISSEAGLEMRGGLNKQFEETGSEGLTMAFEWFDDWWLYAYNGILKAYEVSTGTKTVIKNDFIASSVKGDRYGGYALIASPLDKIGRVSMTLDYDAQTANFTAGTVLTGGTSGATATILEDSDSGVTGTLTLGNISGTFENNETITDSSTGSATADGTLTPVFTSIAAAPMAYDVRIIGERAYALRLTSDETAIQYSDSDTGSNPPFASWNINTTATGGDKLQWRRAGKVNDAIGVGPYTVVYSQHGWWATHMEVIDSAGTLTKDNKRDRYALEHGGNKAIMTPKGIFYVNKVGLFQLLGIGQENIDFSTQEGVTSVPLGSKYFDDISLDNCDMAYDEKRNNIYISCANDSATNNFVIVYNIDLKAFARIKGWNISVFMKIQDDLYGGGANENKLWKLFDGYSDDGADIWTRYYQEINMGDPNTRKMMTGQHILGLLSPSSELDIAFDIYDKTGAFIKRKKALTWTPDASQGAADGYGLAEWGKSAWGGDYDISGATENYAGGSLKIRNFQRLRVDITSHVQSFHKINFLTLLFREKAAIKKRNLAVTN